MSKKKYGLPENHEASNRMWLGDGIPPEPLDIDLITQMLAEMSREFPMLVITYKDGTPQRDET